MVLLDITAKFGYRIKYQLFFEIAQNTKDIYILQAILNFLGTGIISSAAAPLPPFPIKGMGGRALRRERKISKFKIGNLKEIQHILIPFLCSYPLLGFKKLQFDM